MKQKFLKYVGNGAFIVGVPARDLSEEEVKQFSKDILLKSGLYEEQNGTDSDATATGTAENKLHQGSKD